MAAHCKETVCLAVDSEDASRTPEQLLEGEEVGSCKQGGHKNCLRDALRCNKSQSSTSLNSQAGRAARWEATRNKGFLSGQKSVSGSESKEAEWPKEVKPFICLGSSGDQTQSSPVCGPSVIGPPGHPGLKRSGFQILPFPSKYLLHANTWETAWSAKGKVTSSTAIDRLVSWCDFGVQDQKDIRLFHLLPERI